MMMMMMMMMMIMTTMIMIIILCCSDSAITGSAIVNRRGVSGRVKSSEGEGGGQGLSDDDVSDSSRCV